jgi:hypothetical protein
VPELVPDTKIRVSYPNHLTQLHVLSGFLVNFKQNSRIKPKKSFFFSHFLSAGTLLALGIFSSIK